MKGLALLAFAAAAAILSGCSTHSRGAQGQAMGPIEFDPLERDQYEIAETVTGTGHTDRILWFIQTKPSFAIPLLYRKERHSAAINSAWAPRGLFSLGYGIVTALPDGLAWFESSEHLALYDALIQAEDADADTILPLGTRTSTNAWPLMIYVEEDTAVRCKLLRVKPDADLAPQ